MNPIYRLHGPHSLEDLVEAALRHNPFLSGRRVKFQIREAAVTLTGNVGSYFEKQMAQESLRGMAGLNRIHNQLQVVPR